jgi:molybdate transport system regulatory protein
LHMQVDVRVMLKDDTGEPFMGIGIIWLLKGIERYHSVSRAAREMELSYPKALRIIRNIERGLGQPVVVRHKGGSERGGAELTPLGRDFLRRYDRLQQQIRRFATGSFKKAFAKPLINRD